MLRLRIKYNVMKSYDNVQLYLQRYIGQYFVTVERFIIIYIIIIIVTVNIATMYIYLQFALLTGQNALIEPIDLQQVINVCRYVQQISRGVNGINLNESRRRSCKDVLNYSISYLPSFVVMTACAWFG